MWDASTTFVLIWKFYLQHEAEYKEILDAIKGSAKEKRLASQFIGKFFKHFPSLAETAIDAQLDLCEDEDIQVSENVLTANGSIHQRHSFVLLHRFDVKQLRIYLNYAKTTRIILPRLVIYWLNY